MPLVVPTVPRSMPFDHEGHRSRRRTPARCNGQDGRSEGERLTGIGGGSRQVGRCRTLAHHLATHERARAAREVSIAGIGRRDGVSADIQRADLEGRDAVGQRTHTHLNPVFEEKYRAGGYARGCSRYHRRLERRSWPNRAGAAFEVKVRLLDAFVIVCVTAFDAEFEAKSVSPL